LLIQTHTDTHTHTRAAHKVCTTINSVIFGIKENFEIHNINCINNNSSLTLYICCYYWTFHIV